jgi:Kef-type K+ transport system membrane component KefB
VHAHEAISLLIFALGAFAIPLLSGRIGVPAAVGELLFGVVVGPHLLGWIQPNAFTTFLAEFGFAFLMFLAGLELDFRRIERRGVGGLVAGLAVVAGMFALSLALTLLLTLPLFLFIAFGALSLGVLVVTLTEVGLTRSRAGQTMIFVGSLGEFATIVLLTGFGMYYEFGFGWRLGGEMLKLGLIFAAAYVALVVLRTVIWWWPHRFARLVARHDPSELGVRAGMAMMLVFVALATLMGVESILGSFVAGALFAFVFREKRVLEAKMASIGFGFFVPIFFIWVGTEFDLGAVLHLSVLPLLGLFFAVSVCCKLLPSLGLMTQGLRLREALGAGLLFGAPLTLLVVVARIGVDVDVIDQTAAGALVLLAIVTAVVLPWGFRALIGGRRDRGASASP